MPPPPATPRDASSSRGGSAYRRLRQWTACCGPAFVVSVAYVDPGNFAVNTAAGASYGYLLLWVVIAANGLAVLVQYLSAKLGEASGHSLAELCRAHCPRPVTWLLWAQAEAVAIATDLAEIIGGAVALRLLFGVPLLAGAALTAGAALAVLVLAPWGRRSFERVVAGMLLVVLTGFLYQALRAGTASATGAGMLPRLAGQDSLLLATGIIGATVMPHVIYLHSALTSRSAGSGSGRAPRTRLGGIALALGTAGLANAAMLAVAAGALHASPVPADTLAAVHAGLGRQIGRGAAVAFALALLAAGLASSSVGVSAGDAIMSGFLRRRLPMAARRLAGLLPALALLAAGTEPTRALVLSQVVLSFGIPFALVPLVWLTASRSVMGCRANRRATTLAASAVAALISGFNVFLLIRPLLS
ncbi:Nramp family divalent metal transporter [Actinacidiphila sp. DG2A-62]|nr:Nramp family divalent metal transporter [Actinacidiphila sp. DG2A-62]MEC3992745.1 Nramp family divalent metal transporter [Actinacidiphila sp. DG2A-62]